MRQMRVRCISCFRADPDWLMSGQIAALKPDALTIPSLSTAHHMVRERHKPARIALTNEVKIAREFSRLQYDLVVGWQK
jgi:hypothetical protein